MCLTIAFWVSTPMIVAHADCASGTFTDAGDGSFDTTSVSASCGADGGGAGDSGSAPHPAAENAPQGTTSWQFRCNNLRGQETCTDYAACADGTDMQELLFYPANGGDPVLLGNNCGGPIADPPTPTGPSLGDVRHAFERIPLPESVLVIQPPGGATLVNFDTNFYTVAGPFEQTVTLLGHQVHFKIRPRSFAWHYGDGKDQSTTKPGAAYPALQVSHRYLKKGTVAASVDTVWEADFQIDGGAWAPVDATVTKGGAPQQLTIKSATPILVG